MENKRLPDLKTGLIYSCIFHLILGLCLVVFLWLANHELSFALFKERFNAWDGNTYSYLATHGYTTVGESANYIVFYPLYPLLIWIVMWIIPEPHIAGVLLSVTGSLLGHAFFYQLLRTKGYSTQTSRRTLLLLCLSPMTVYFVLVHTEGIFLLWIVLFFLSLHHQKWSIAATFGLLATLTRFTGITLIIPFIAVMFQHRKMKSVSVWFCCLVTISGFFFYLGLNTFLFHSPLYYQHIMATNWSKSPVNPITKYIGEVRGFRQLPIDPPTFQIDTFLTLLTPVLIGLFFLSTKKKVDWSLLLFSLTTWMIITAQSYWLSNTRYLGLILPLYMYAEELTTISKWIYLSIVCILSIMALGSVWIFAQGGWLY